MDWPEIWSLMEVSTIFYICRYCVFTWGGRFGVELWRLVQKQLSGYVSAFYCYVIWATAWVMACVLFGVEFWLSNPVCFLFILMGRIFRLLTLWKITNFFFNSVYNAVAILMVVVHEYIRSQCFSCRHHFHSAAKRMMSSLSLITYF